MPLHNDIWRLRVVEPNFQNGGHHFSNAFGKDFATASDARGQRHNITGPLFKDVDFHRQFVADMRAVEEIQRLRLIERARPRKDVAED
jgi:hypothetical protein